MNKIQEYRVMDIIRGTTVDGPGFRTAIYLAGCAHHCMGCHNPQSWDPSNGRIMNLHDIMAIIEEEEFDVTLTGGDPLFTPWSTLLLCKTIKKAGHNIWLYTGFTLEEIKKSKIMASVLMHIDALVDGPYIESLHDGNLRFRGSSNQRIILKEEFFLDK